MTEYVYHASPVQGLEIIHPMISTHGRRWIYAAKDSIMASVFLGRLGGDLTCKVGRFDLPFICEMYPGAFDLRYANKKGSLYKLDPDFFVGRRTSWLEDFVSPKDVVPIEEKRVDMIKQYLMNLKDSGLIIIKFFPESLSWLRFISRK